MKNSNTRKQEHNIPPKNRVLRSSLSSFAKEGKAGAIMQKIADNADVNKATVYYYFNSKDNLYKLILKSAFQGFINTIHDKLVQDTQNITIDTFYSLLNEIFESKRNESKLIIRDLLEGGDTLKEIIKQQIKDDNCYYQKLSEISAHIEPLLKNYKQNNREDQILKTINIILEAMTNWLLNKVLSFDV